MKKLIEKINRFFKWLSRDTMNAINNGASYEEVETIINGGLKK